jgi:hypothetical protein
LSNRIEPRTGVTASNRNFSIWMVRICFIFGRFRVRFLSRKPPVLTEVCRCVYSSSSPVKFLDINDISVPFGFTQLIQLRKRH